MLDLMPSPRLVFNEWDRHGTCSGLEPQAYFDAVRKSYASVKIPEKFLNVTNYLTVTPDEVEDAFVAANPGMSRGSGRGHLRHKAAERSPHLPEQGTPVSRLSGGRPPRLPARQDRDAADARRVLTPAAGRMPPTRAASVYNSGDELSSRLSRRKFRRRGQARDPVPHRCAFAQERQRLSRHRYPCRRGALRSDRRRKPRAVREWRDGIGRLLEAAPDAAAQTLLRDYLGAVQAANPDGKIVRYPGSPALVRAWLRRADRLVACELEPSAQAALSHNFHGDRRVKVDRDRRLASPVRLYPTQGTARIGADRSVL